PISRCSTIDPEGYCKKMVTSAARREAVAHLRAAYEVSERRARSALGANRTSVRCRLADRTMRWSEFACASWPPFAGGYPAHEGIAMNQKKLRRLYREERLQVGRRGGRKRALGTRAPMAIPQGAWTSCRMH